MSSYGYLQLLQKAENRYWAPDTADTSSGTVQAGHENIPTEEIEAATNTAQLEQEKLDLSDVLVSAAYTILEPNRKLWL